MRRAGRSDGPCIRPRLSAVDPRERTIREILEDPVVTARYGPLALEFTLSEDEQRYVHGGDGHGGVTKGKVLVEVANVTIRAGGAVVLTKTYRGDRPRKEESFGDELPVHGGYRVKVYEAEIDYVNLARTLLDPLENAQLKAAMASNLKYIQAAARVIAEPWRNPVRGGAWAAAEDTDDAD